MPSEHNPNLPDPGQPDRPPRPGRTTRPKAPPAPGPVCPSSPPTPGVPPRPPAPALPPGRTRPTPARVLLRALAALRAAHAALMEVRGLKAGDLGGITDGPAATAFVLGDVVPGLLYAIETGTRAMAAEVFPLGKWRVAGDGQGQDE